MSLLIVFIAACCAATVNFCLRKNIEYGGSQNAYFSMYFIFSLISSFLINFKISLANFCLLIVGAGTAAGLLNFAMMLLIARALMLGPSGLTFAFQNSGSILPALFMFFLFGSAFGFTMSLPLIFGFICILVGLFLSARVQKEPQPSARKTSIAKWLSLAILVCLIQGIIMTLFQWRSLLLTAVENDHLLIPRTCSIEEDKWFMPGFFFFPAIIQTVLFGLYERRFFTKKEAFLGMTGGVLNGLATFFLLLAAKSAQGFEKAILFPLFAVSVIFLCSLWGKKFYQEKVFWPGLALCGIGVFAGAF